MPRIFRKAPLQPAERAGILAKHVPHLLESMKTKLLVRFAAALVMTSLVVSAEDKSQPAPQSPSAPAKSDVKNTPDPAKSPVIGFVETRGRTITIKAGPKDTIYSVTTTDGKVLCENVSLEQLRAKAPDLHDFIKTAVVQSAKGAKIDASIRDSSIR
jgi:hypothetical protein